MTSSFAIEEVDEPDSWGEDAYAIFGQLDDNGDVTLVI